MATLLHLSDLHLGNDHKRETLSHDRSGVIPRESQQSVFARMLATLEWLARRLHEEHTDLECIVITGDIADQNNPDGYRLLPDLLAPLVRDLVPPERVIVVPGNHDVKRHSPSSTAERYENYLTLRTHGYLTPRLEGVDITESGAPLRADAQSPIYTARDGSFIVVALNSANHSQAPAPRDEKLDELEAELSRLRSSEPAVQALWEAWERRGDADPCWINTGQLTSAGNALREADSDNPDALRIAALHHQILPVSPWAEIKPYETIINLGEVFEWISDHRVDVVLHGHKHVGRVTTMNAQTLAYGDDDDDDRRVLLISGPLGRPTPGPPSPVARLLTVEPGEPRVSGVRVQDIPHTASGSTRRLTDTSAVRHVLDTNAELGVIKGATVHEVHRKLMALGDDAYGPGSLLTCVIEDGATALKLPDSYPPLPVADDGKQAWFEQTIAWWQSPNKGSAADFNHGQRLRNFFPPEYRSMETLDQLERAAAALKVKSHSSRAIAILVDPSRDLAKPDGPEFPAFSLVQFAIHDDKLNVTAYFRKQEMPHWWPINVGELASLQRDLADMLRPTLPVSAGSITTITPHPVRGSSVPRVSVPSLDQRVDSDAGLLELVLPLFGSAGPSVETARAWRVAFADWEPGPGEPADGDPIPLTGLRKLYDLLGHVSVIREGTPKHRDLHDKLYGLRSKCEEYSKSRSSPTPQSRSGWIAEWHRQTRDILVVVDSLLAERDPGGATGAAGPNPQTS